MASISGRIERLEQLMQHPAFDPKPEQIAGGARRVHVW